VEIFLDTYLLCSPNIALGRVGPSGMSLNGDSIVDPVPFFRALAIAYFARGGESVEWQFRVVRLFNTERLAHKFALLHRTQLPRQGRIKVTVGASGDTEDIYLEDAIVQPTAPSIVGTAVVVQYSVKGGIPSTDVPDPLPSTDPEEESVSFRRGKVSIGNGDETVDVTFSAPLAGDLVISPRISHVSGEDAIDCELLEDTISADGFSVKLSAATTSANYKLHYTAFA
jgi:hypothetical protein